MPDIPRVFRYKHSEDGGNNSRQLLQEHTTRLLSSRQRRHADSIKCFIKQ